MWVRVAVWEVQTGEVSQLSVGDAIERLGVRATFWTLEPSDEADDVTELAGPDPAGEDAPYYRVVGRVTWTCEPHSLVVSVGPFRLVAEPMAVGAVEVSRQHERPLDPVLPDVGLPEVGDRVALVARLSSMLEYEPDAFGYPDVSRAWVVRRLRVEHRELVTSSAYPRGSEPGRILRVVDIPRMLRWADAPRDSHASYLVDVVPTR